jgi:hypothetical protein
MKRRRKLYRWLVDYLIELLTEERASYHQRFPNDLEALRATLKPGDVVLVEGSQRVSEVIKYLTQSSWSHVALYVGDAILKRGGTMAAGLSQELGVEAGALLVEANPESGVVAVPLSKYKNHNIRICRPINLRPGDLSTVLETIISQIGRSYDVRHVVELLRYFFPVTLIPKRLRRTALEHSGEFSKQVICSTQIAAAFQKVRYPIQPLITELTDVPIKTVGLPSLRLVFARRTRPNLFETGLFTACDPHFVTPRDFDLSPYFEVVKFSANTKREFDYKKLKWSVPATIAAPAPVVADEAEPLPAAVVAATATTKIG